MASAEQLKMNQNIDDRVASVQGEVQGTRGDVQIVRGEVQHVGHGVQAIDNRVQGINTEVKDISSKVQGVDDRLSRDIRSLSITLIPMALTSSQGTSSEIAFFDGFRPPTNLPIISWHANSVTTAPLGGFSKEVYSRSGSPSLLAPSCGYTESVRHSWPSLRDDP